MPQHDWKIRQLAQVGFTGKLTGGGGGGGGGDPIGDALRAAAIGYWKMDESPNGNRLDSTSNHFDLIEVDNGNTNAPAPNTVASAAGKINNCVVTVDDPTDANILANLNLVVNISSGFFVALWVKRNVWDAGFYGSQSSDPFFLFGQTSLLTSIAFRFPVIASTASGTIYMTSLYAADNEPTRQIPLVDTNWHFVLSWYDPNESPIQYHTLVDNVTEFIRTTDNHGTPLTVSDNVFVTTAHIEIGSPNFNDVTDAIYMDEVLFAHGVPTQDQKDYLWNNGNGRTLYP